MDEIVKGIVGPYGAIFLLVAIGFTGFTKKWVFTYIMTDALLAKDVLFAAIVTDKDKQITRAQEDADEWKGIALRALNVSEKVVKTKEK